ncbi:MAG: hypothetical protein ACFB15_08460 [Cyclobacteriaceae bacterium]
MESQPFYKSTLEPTSVWNKLTGKRSEKNAIVEINNLLAEKPLMEVKAEDIQTVLKPYQLNLFTDFTDGSLRELYQTYLRYCFEDNHLDEEEIGRLKHLKRLLGLKEEDVDLVHHRVCQEVYERELETALEDHRLDKKELKFLENLRTKLQLPPAVATRLHQHKAQAIIFQFIKGVIADERLSPDEEVELQALTENLQVAPTLDESTQRQLTTYRLLWQVENGELPAIHVPIALEKGEVCHYLTSSTWIEEPANPKQKPGKKPLSSKLLEGTYWKVEEGTILPANTQTDAPTGKLYLTNQRMILRGNEQEKYVHLDSITDFQPHSDGIAIFKNKGKTLLLALRDDAEVFSILLGRVLRDR